MGFNIRRAARKLNKGIENTITGLGKEASRAGRRTRLELERRAERELNKGIDRSVAGPWKEAKRAGRRTRLELERAAGHAEQYVRDFKDWNNPPESDLGPTPGIDPQQLSEAERRRARRRGGRMGLVGDTRGRGGDTVG